MIQTILDRAVVKAAVSYHAFHVLNSLHGLTLNALNRSSCLLHT